jgi:hypothetical protein
MVLAFSLPASFAASVIPGVRGFQGYSAMLDGLLGTLAAAAVPVICLLRLRRARGRDRTTGLVLALALALAASGTAAPVAQQVADGRPGPLAAAALPLLDLLLLVVTTLSLFRWRPPAGRGLLALGVALLAAADAHDLLTAAGDTVAPERLAAGIRVLALTIVALSPGWPPRRHRGQLHDNPRLAGSGDLDRPSGQGVRGRRFCGAGAEAGESPVRPVAGAPAGRRTGDDLAPTG